MEKNILNNQAFPAILPGGYYPGMTRHQYATILIAQGLVAKYNLKTPQDQKIIAELSYQIAEEILNQFKNT